MYLRHGRSQTPEYKCWQQIKARCLNPNHKAYPEYGGRGITIYAGWVKDFEAFLAHVGPRPSAKHSLDRRENDQGYVPGNLRWASRKVQNNNRRPHRPRGSKVRKPSSGRVTNYKHGRIHTTEYSSWLAMKDRCLNPKSSNYPNWGGRGIAIYQPWKDDFMAFFQAVGPKPSPQHSLDRYPDLNGNYEPGNVRWATKLEQTQNRRPCKTGPEHGNSTHGHTGSPEHKTWGSIKTRCFNPRHDRYPDYGGVGITMCQRWRDSFSSFLEDLGTKPSPSHTLMRLDHSGSYSCGKCPECLSLGWVANCRWGTRTEQNRNRRLSSRSGKLTPVKVQAIHDRLSAGATHKQVAQEFGIGFSLVGKIKRGENWA
jgi:hypothetical protein